MNTKLDFETIDMLSKGIEFVKKIKSFLLWA